jgi:Uma2 family endonuclease
MTLTRGTQTESKWPRMTYEEYLSAPGIPEHTEWVNGEVIEMMTVSKAHAELAGYLHKLLAMYVEFKELGEFYQEPFQMRAAPDGPGRSPDLMFLRAAHMDRLQNQFLDGPADLVIEVLSPSTENIDRGDKFYEYQRAGVAEYWIVDPIREVAEFYVLDSHGVFRAANVPPDGAFASTVLDGFRLNVEWLWTRKRVGSVLKELGVTL